MCAFAADVCHDGRVLNAEDLITQLRAKAAWHEAEAARYRTALEIVSAETETKASRSDVPSVRPPSAANVSPSGRPSRTDTVALALAAVTGEGREWGAQDVVAAMEQAGWSGNVSNKVNTVRTALSRLADRGEIERVRHGVYKRLNVQPMPEPTDDTGPDLPVLDGSGPSASVEALT